MQKNNNCMFCGSNPTPHFLAWYFESITIFFTPVRQFFLKSSLMSASIFYLKKFGIGLLFFRLLLKLKILRLQEQASLCKVKRAQVLWEEACKRGVKMQEILFFKKGIDYYIAEKNGIQILFSGLPRPNNFNHAVLDTLDDKFLVKQKLKENNLPVPKGGSFWNFFSARNIFDQISKPVIVKPRLGSRGRHSTTFVFTPSDLKRAYKIAKQLCFWVVVEEQLSGPVFRATVVNFQLQGVLKGEMPSVVGNGALTIRELIEQKNLHKDLKVKDVMFDQGLEIFLARQGLGLKYIPRNNEQIFLSEKIGVNYGGSSSEDFEICHPDNKNLFETAAKILGDPLIGFDFIIPDISRSYLEQKSGFLEANSLPFIQLHHEPLLGKPRNVAEKIWEMVGF